jgi:hypothetical protein
MPDNIIHRHNVGRIAERIVANELEFRGFRVSDLNKEGIAANADLLASKDGKTWQIQVKGASYDNSWWVNYIHSKEGHFDKSVPIYNSSKAFYRADTVVLVCVASPCSYKSLVLPVDIAEKAAQLALDRTIRVPKKDGTKKKDAKIWTYFDHIPKTRNKSLLPIYEEEIALLAQYIDNWDL